MAVLHRQGGGRNSSGAQGDQALTLYRRCGAIGCVWHAHQCGHSPLYRRCRALGRAGLLHLAAALAGRWDCGWVGLVGSAHKERRIYLFPKYFTVQKHFQKSLVNVYNARKILRKYPKFEENFQRNNGTRTIQIKYLELIKRKSILINRISLRKVRINSRKVQNIL
jgi:hypothetical protein